MIKKLLLTAAFVLPIFSAENSFIASITEYKGADYGGHGLYLITNKSYYPDGTPGIYPGRNYTNNWVGVYKKGASNDWKNVLKWSWANKLESCTDNSDQGCINIGGFEDGEYDIRYFLNNSFTTDYSKTVKLESANDPSFIKIRDKLGCPEECVIDVDASSRGAKTWVGIYKKGTSNDWKNVLGWNWYTPIYHTNDIKALTPLDPNTTYEVRLFYHNSYKLAAKAEFTPKGYGIEVPKIYIAQQRDSGVVFATTTSGEGNKDWVGLYKVGASNSWNNVKAWSWVDVEPGVYGKGFSVEGLPSGEYELRLFYRNSYILEAVKPVTLSF